MLKVEPHNSQALYLLGNLYYELKENEAARDVLESIPLFPSPDTAAQTLLAGTLLKLNDYERALPLFLAVTKSSPIPIDAHHNLALCYQRLGCFSEAASAYEKALEISPQSGSANLGLALCALELNYPDAAIEILSRCILRCPDYLPAYSSLARILEQSGNTSQAAAILQSCLNSGSQDANVIRELARLQFSLCHWPQAEDLLRRSLAVEPENIDIKAALAATLTHQAKLDEAEILWRETINHRSDDIVTLINYSNYLIERGKFDEAITCAKRSVALKPDMPEAWNCLGMVLQLLQHFEESLEAYDKAISLRPNYHDALSNKGQSLLKLGRLKEGWGLYQNRFNQTHNKLRRRDMAIKQWQDGGGGWGAKGGRLFLWTDQGIGDEIIYSSMIPDATMRVARCAVECSKRLRALFTRSFADVEVIGKNFHSNADIEAFAPDFQLSLPELGLVTRPDFAAFPKHSGYLRPDPEMTQALRSSYEMLAAGRVIVGISWKSENLKTGHHKSIPLQQWLPILRTNNVFFVSLQYGDQDQEISTIGGLPGSGIHRDHSVDTKGDLDRFAAQVAAMDLVITVSNTTAHFAGAMNVPVWTLISEGPGALWYWFHDRDDSPWYPSMKLFRQSKAGHWGDVLSAVKSQLGTLV